LVLGTQNPRGWSVCLDHFLVLVKLDLEREEDPELGDPRGTGTQEEGGLSLDGWEEGEEIGTGGEPGGANREEEEEEAAELGVEEEVEEEDSLDFLDVAGEELADDVVFTKISTAFLTEVAGRGGGDGGLAPCDCTTFGFTFMFEFPITLPGGCSFA